MKLLQQLHSLFTIGLISVTLAACGGGGGGGGGASAESSEESTEQTPSVQTGNAPERISGFHTDEFIEQSNSTTTIKHDFWLTFFNDGTVRWNLSKPEMKTGWGGSFSYVKTGNNTGRLIVSNVAFSKGEYRDLDMVINFTSKTHAAATTYWTIKQEGKKTVVSDIHTVRIRYFSGKLDTNPK